MKISRREFVWVGLVAFGTAILGLLTLDFQQVCRAMILEDIARLRIDTDSVDVFIDEAERECFWEKFTWKKRIFVTLQHGLNTLGIKLPMYYKYLQARDLITGTFLMSTDMFFAGSHTTKINYLGFHNPYKVSCSNPFSSLWVSEATIKEGWNSVTTTALPLVAK